MSTGSNGAQLLIPGIIALVKLPDGSAIAKVHELVSEITVADACELLKLGKTRVNELCDQGEIDWRWSSPLEGKRLLVAASVEAYRQRMRARAAQTAPLF